MRYLLSVFLVVGLLGLWGGAVRVEAQNLELVKPGELSAATEGTYPPFSMVDANGNLQGLEIGVIKEVSKRLKLEYKPVLMKWESILVGLFADQYDLSTAAMDITAERQKQILFSNGWLESGGKLVVRKDSPIQKVSDIKGKVVGCLVASTWAKIAEGLGAKEVKLYKAESDALQDLANKNIDGVVTEAIAAGYAIQNTKLPVRALDEYLSRIQKGLAFKKNKVNLVKAVNKALDDMHKDGTYARITKELVGFDPYPKEPIKSIFSQ